MSISFHERLAALKSPRFKIFVEGKEACESFLQEMHVRLEEMSEAHVCRAREDPRIHRAESAFAAAIEMSHSEGALADEVVAMYQLGLIRHLRGELGEAGELIRAALAVLSSLPGEHRGPHMSACHYHLGVIALKQRQMAIAVQELNRARQLDEANLDLSGMRLCDFALAACAAAGADLSTDGDGLYVDEEDWSPADCEAVPAVEEDIEAEPERKPDVVVYSQRELIWLASYSAQANDELMSHLASLGDEFRRPVSVDRVAFGSADPAQNRLPEPARDQHLCAAILVLEREGLEDPAFQELAGLCMRRVVAVPDFRLLVYLHGLTIEELRNLADRELWLADLFDTTQIAASPSLDQLRRALVPYLRRVERIRVASLWRQWRLLLSGLLGRLATAMLFASALIALLGFPAWLLRSNLSWLGPYGPQLASLVLGVLAFPLQAPLLFLLLRGMQATAKAPRDNAALMRMFVVGTVILMGANHLQNSLHGPSSWVFLGLAAGTLLDAIRRAGLQARRQAIEPEALRQRAKDLRLQSPKEMVLRGDPLKTLVCPLLPRLAARIFISYTPSSDKGSRLAAALHRGLKEAGSSLFLDRATIPPGASWRRVLNQFIGECDSFVCILDERSVLREWVAAELLAALEAYRLTGTPEIVILLDPGVQRPSHPMLPVFRGVVEAAELPQIPGRPQILRLNALTRSSLIWALSPGRFMPTSVFPRATAVPILFGIGLSSLLGLLGVFAGWGLLVAAMLETLAKVPFSSGLADRGWLAPATLLVAFWLGFTARTTISQGYEGEHKQGKGAAALAIATLGLAYAFFLLIPRVSVLETGWSLVLVVTGWVVVASAKRMGWTQHRAAV